PGRQPFGDLGGGRRVHLHVARSGRRQRRVSEELPPSSRPDPPGDPGPPDSPVPPGPPHRPAEGDAATAEADLRAALQHRDAELARQEELIREMDALVRRARELLGGLRSDSFRDFAKSRERTRGTPDGAAAAPPPE